MGAAEVTGLMDANALVTQHYLLDQGIVEDSLIFVGPGRVTA